MFKLHITENYEIPKNTYEYCLKHFMYPNYNKVPKGTIYHNTHLEYVDAITHNGILVSKAKQLEYSGNMTWATTLPNQKGYGGCTVAFTLDGLEDRYDYEKVNSVEYCIYKDIPAKNILFIDLPVVDGSGIGLTRLSDIPELVEEYGVEKVQNVFNKYGDKYIPLEDILPYLKLTNSIKEDYNDCRNIKYLYHSVFSKDVEDYVDKNGITVDEHGFIYLSQHPYKTKYTTATYKVRIPDNNYLYDWREFWYDEDGEPIDFDHEYDETNPYYIYMMNIPVNYINKI